MSSQKWAIMPANRGTQPDWQWSREFSQRFPLDPERNHEAYIATDVADCADYLASLALPELVGYDNENGARDALTADLAKKVFRPEQPVWAALMEYRAAQNSPAAVQDREHERLLAMAKAERSIAAKTGQLINAQQRFLAVSVLANGDQLSCQVSQLPASRSFG